MGGLAGVLVMVGVFWVGGLMRSLVGGLVVGLGGLVGGLYRLRVAVSMLWASRV